MDLNNKVYGIFSSFSSLHLELALGSRIINKFSDRFSFNLSNKKEKAKSTFNNSMKWFFNPLLHHLQPLL